MNAHATLVPQFGWDEAQSDIEQKYLFHAARKHLLLDWLEFHAVRDPEFYFSPVLSLYYDTPGLRFYREVCDGDYLKTKVRLRWYQKALAGQQHGLDCYLEIKRKSGARRYKSRQHLTLEPRCLTGDIFSQREIMAAPEALPEVRPAARGVLVPILIVEYERYRFIEPRSGARIALDVGIHCSRANPAYLTGAPPVHLSTGVLEVKGALDALPGCLRPMQRHLRKQSFSKYARCCGLLIDPLEGAYYE